MSNKKLGATAIAVAVSSANIAVTILAAWFHWVAVLVIGCSLFTAFTVAGLIFVAQDEAAKEEEDADEGEIVDEARRVCEGLMEIATEGVPASEVMRAVLKAGPDRLLLSCGHDLPWGNVPQGIREFIEKQSRVACVECAREIALAKKDSLK